jgi:hypothetical protein
MCGKAFGAGRPGRDRDGFALAPRSATLTGAAVDTPRHCLTGLGPDGPEPLSQAGFYSFSAVGKSQRTQRDEFDTACSAQGHSVVLKRSLRTFAPTKPQPIPTSDPASMTAHFEIPRQRSTWAPCSGFPLRRPAFHRYCEMTLDGGDADTRGAPGTARAREVVDLDGSLNRHQLRAR